MTSRSDQEQADASLLTSLARLMKSRAITYAKRRDQGDHHAPS